MRILVPVDESLHSRRVIEFISHRETLLGTTPEIELVNVQYSVPETIIHLFGMEAVKQYYLEAGKKVFDELGPEALRRRGVTERVLYGDIGKTLAEEA
ncbi:MAG: universal stress protein, partial [Sutterella wadsworthensis]|nr:universal stress protein [Sutterella wadsworthensis]